MIEKLIVFRDKDGNVVNIGEWDLMVSYDDENKIIINNPIPDDATSSLENVFTNEDGSRSVVSNQ